MKRKYYDPRNHNGWLRNWKKQNADLQKKFCSWEKQTSAKTQAWCDEKNFVGPDSSFCLDLNSNSLMWILVIVKNRVFLHQVFLFCFFYSWLHTQVSTKTHYDSSCPSWFDGWWPGPFQSLPQLSNVTQQEILDNYLQVKKDVQNIIQNEMAGILDTPELCILIIRKD